MPPSDHDQMLRETYRLSKENNKMLHKMRRHALWGGIVKFVLYAALLLIPAYIYLQYLAPIMQQMLHTMNEIQGTGAKAQAQFTDWQQALEQLKGKIPGMNSSSSGN